MSIVALDIGGANIKVADGLGYARSWPFALWKAPEELTGKIAECLAASPKADEIVVTMTGELCDCFETKRDGVRAIIKATLEAAHGTPVLFYQTSGRFVAAGEAIETHLLTAASNWHALASFVARLCDDRISILIDIGSTTTDIIPIEYGRETARGRTDPERLSTGELSYMGVKRTPACAIVTHLRWRGTTVRVANELFAYLGDAYLLLSELPEDAADTDTADGKPFTKAAAHTRLARMICGDRDMVTFDDALSFAWQIRKAQEKNLAHNFVQSLNGLTGMPRFIIASGEGEFLVSGLLHHAKVKPQVISLTDRLGSDVSRCATAHALAVLARESLP